MGTQIAETVRVEAVSSEAWLAEKRKFRELTAFVCAHGEATEQQESGLSNFSEVLRGVNEAAPHRMSCMCDATIRRPSQ